MSSNAIVQNFNPPGYADDLQPEHKEGWHQFINQSIEQAKKGRTFTYSNGELIKILNNAPREQFFNPSTTEKLNDYTEKTIAWFGFPKQVKDDVPSDKARWKLADSSSKRENQDEYCEWSVMKNEEGKIIQVSFTCEGPEYWEYLAETNPDKVVALYKQWISENVEKKDLFDEHGKYNPLNEWNTTKGAMHLIQINNTLGAEIELAAGSSMIREKDGRILDEQQELIDCGSYGAPGRNSDPLIGWEVNNLSRAGAMVSLRDPVGLYIDLEEFKTDGWETPDGSNPREFMRIVRGIGDTALRAIFKVPEEKGYTVGDIKINGNPIKYGGMIADFVRIKLVGIAQNIGHTPTPTFGCVQYVRAASHPTLASSEAESMSASDSGGFGDLLPKESRRAAHRIED